MCIRDSSKIIHAEGEFSAAQRLVDAAHLLSSEPASIQLRYCLLYTSIPLERIKRNYEEDAFHQMTMQMGSWAEERFARSDPCAHARFHVELGKELLAHGFSTEAEAEFRHAAAVDPASTAPLTALAEDYDARGDARGARAQAEAALRIRESAEAYVILAPVSYTHLDVYKRQTLVCSHRSHCSSTTNHSSEKSQLTMWGRA